MANMEQFGRSIEVVAGIQGSEGFQVTADPATLSATGRPPRIDFRVTDKADGKPTRGSVTLYNPPDELISDLLSGEDAFLRLSAGYRGNIEPLFSGEPIRDGSGVTRSERGDLQLTVAALAGGARFRDATFSASLAGRQSVRDLAERFATEGGWRIGRNDIPTSAVYPRGFFDAGDTVAALERLARYTGMDLAFSGSTVNFLDMRTDPPAGAESVPLFSSKTGIEGPGNLVGSVQRTDEGLKFRAFLVGGLAPGDQALVEHYDYVRREFVRERLVLRDVTYVGSNYGRQFYIEGVGRAVQVG